MPHHRSPRPRRPDKGPSRRNRHDWLDAALQAKIRAIADMLDRKADEDDIAKASVWQGGRPPAGPASREDACDDGANTPSMPR